MNEVKQKPDINQVEFNENRTTRQWLSQQKARIRTAIRGEIIPDMIDAMKEPKLFHTVDDILDLPHKDFNILIRKYTNTYNMSTSVLDDFLG